MRLLLDYLRELTQGKVLRVRRDIESDTRTVPVSENLTGEPSPCQVFPDFHQSKAKQIFPAPFTDIPAFGVIQMPYMFSDASALNKLVETDTYKKWEKQFEEQGIKKLRKFEDKFIETKDMASFVNDVKVEALNLAMNIIAETLERYDEEIRKSTKRKDHWSIIRTDVKSLITSIGTINFKKTFYKDRRNILENNYCPNCNNKMSLVISEKTPCPQCGGTLKEEF